MRLTVLVCKDVGRRDEEKGDNATVTGVCFYLHDSRGIKEMNGREKNFICRRAGGHIGGWRWREREGVREGLMHADKGVRE